jgi:hypothetical protein
VPSAIAREVRNLVSQAPATGVASTEATAPTADTTPSAAGLCRGVMSWSWIGSSQEIARGQRPA